MALPGTVLTDRDRRLFAYFALARHLTAEQVHVLLGDAHASQQTYRRLRRLAAGTPADSGAALLSRQEIRTRAGPPLGFWSLTSRGWSEAEKVLSYAVSRPDSRVGAQFLLHQMLVNQILVDLTYKLDGSSAPALSTLPFRWIPEATGQLNFKHQDRRGLYTPTAVKPDAIIEIPGTKRRLFLEAETGSQSITTSHHSPLRSGSIKQKLLRYAAYFTALNTDDLKSTWYTQAFQDDLFPELLFVVHSHERKERVAWIVSRRLAKLPEPRPFAVRVLCLDEAAAAIAAITTTKHVPRKRLLTVSEASAAAIRDRVNELVQSFNGLLALVNAHNKNPKAERITLPPLPTETLHHLKTLIHSELLAKPFNAPRWREHLVEETKEGSAR